MANILITIHCLRPSNGSEKKREKLEESILVSVVYRRVDVSSTEQERTLWIFISFHVENPHPEYENFSQIALIYDKLQGGLAVFQKLKFCHFFF